MVDGVSCSAPPTYEPPLAREDMFVSYTTMLMVISYHFHEELSWIFGCFQVCRNLMYFFLFLFFSKQGQRIVYEECETDDYCPKYRDLLYVFKCIDKRCELVEANV